jgi:NADP-dependent 3-hydroxy acid dehydrogenase YdfG
MSKQVILVTGASSGFGLMTARALAQAGHTVYASMRETEGRNAPRVAEAAAWSKAEGFDLRTVELDVQSDSSTEAGVAQILKDAGSLDVIVHNAGHMVFGPAEAFTPEQFIQQYDVNVLGAQRVNRAALPHMRGRGKGLLVWVGSSSTRGGTPPFLAPYFAAKAAMDALAACRTESFHILGIVENGRFRLPWRFDLAALAPVDPANRPLSIAVHRAPGLPRPRQAGARTNIRFRFQAIVTRLHSPRTLSSPRSEN